MRVVPSLFRPRPGRPAAAPRGGRNPKQGIPSAEEGLEPRLADAGPGTSAAEDPVSRQPRLCRRASSSSALEGGALVVDPHALLEDAHGPIGVAGQVGGAP